MKGGVWTPIDYNILKKQRHKSCTEEHQETKMEIEKIIKLYHIV